MATSATLARAAGIALAIAPAIALSSGCSELPRDPDGTTEQIARSRTILLGVVSGAPPSPRAEAVLAKVGGKLGARPNRVTGTGEELLDKLEKGELDLVYGRFAMKSPWSKSVHFGAPLSNRRKVGADERVPRFAYTHGENGWIMRVEREIAP